jgi:antitoxin YefM
MDAVSYSDFHRKLKSYLDRAYADNNPLIITRKNNQNLVLISMTGYNALLETNHLVANEANASHPMNSIKQARLKISGRRERFGR